MSKDKAPLHIDGRRGEGGGQVLRSSLALSMLTGRPLRLTSVRAGRGKPGLLRQHLTAVRAAAAICAAKVDGATLGSDALSFTPGAVSPGDYAFAIGSAGSTGLVLQTVLPALLFADGPSRITIDGGTHNPGAPPFDFIHDTFFAALNRLAPAGAPPPLRGALQRYGFYPAGGGRVTYTVTPTRLGPIALCERGAITEQNAVAVWANLPLKIAERELATLAERLGWPRSQTRYRELADCDGTGNYLKARLANERVCETVSGFGLPGVRAEDVAAEVARAVNRYLNAGVAVGEHLADQLLLPLALFGGAFTTLAPSRHTLTNTGVIEEFLPRSFVIDELGADRWRIACRRGNGHGASGVAAREA